MDGFDSLDLTSQEEEEEEEEEKGLLGRTDRGPTKMIRLIERKTSIQRNPFKGSDNVPCLKLSHSTYTGQNYVDHNWKSTSPRVLKPDLPPAPALSKESFEKMKHSFNFSLVGLVGVGGGGDWLYDGL